MQRLCELTTPLGDALLFSRMRVSEGLSRLFEIQLEAVSVKQDIDPKALLGKTATIKVTFEDGKQRFYNGHIVRLSLGGARGRHFVYHLVLRPWLWFPTRTTDCKIFQEKNVPSIVDAVLSDEPTKAVDDRISDRGKYQPWEYCVQYRETDFNFISRLFEQEGIYYFFEHRDGAHQQILIDNKGRHEFVTGDQSISFAPASPGMSQPIDHVSEWGAQQEIQSGCYVIDDYDFKRPSTELRAQRLPEIPSGWTKADYEVYDYPGDYDTYAEGDHYAAARIEELNAQATIFRGAGKLRFFQAGRRFKLTDHPRKDQNGEYLILATDYDYVDPAYESGGGAGSGFNCSFTAIRSNQQFRPLRTTPRPLIQGIQTALVTGPGGDEIFTDSFGRIKVQFHWDRYGKKDDKSSCWLRVAFLAAGANWGFVSIPRIGHEVVINFLEGDPDRPLVTGVVYNGANKPPWDLPANKTQSGMLTRSSKGGAAANANAIRFEDKKGAEQLWLHAEKNQDIEVENDETHWVGHDRTKTVDHDETVHVKHDRTETVDNNEKITIGVNRTESVGSNETIAIGSNRTETVGSNETVTIGSNRTHTVMASETLTVALQRTETVGINETITVGAAQEVTVGGTRALTVGVSQTTTIGTTLSETVGTDRTVSIGANDTLKVAENRSGDVGADDSLKVAKNRNAEVGEDDSLKIGKNLVIDAGDSITFKTGSAVISMKKDGTILIKGKDITIDGSGKINVKADGNIVMKGSKIEQN